MLTLREFVKDKESLPAARESSAPRRVGDVPPAPGIRHAAFGCRGAQLPTICAPAYCSAHRFLWRTIKRLPPPFRPRMTAGANFVGAGLQPLQGHGVFC